MGLRAFLWRDARLLCRDWKGLALTFALPVIVAALSGFAFAPMSGGTDGPAIRLLLVDEDGSPGARRLVERFAAMSGVGVEELPATATAEHRAGRERAHDAIRLGKRPAALLIPAGTGARVEAGIFGAAFSGGPPTLTLWVDPSKQAQVGMLQGALYRAAMEVVARDSFSRGGGTRQLRENLERLRADPDVAPETRTELEEFFQRGLKFMEVVPQGGRGGADGGGGGGAGPFAGGMPEPVRFEVAAVSAAGRSGSPAANYNAFAHAFAGMGVMFLLFGVLEGGLFLIRERNRGTLARVVSSPTPAVTILVAQMLWGILLGVAQLGVMLTVAWFGFGVRVVGSWTALALVAVAASAAASGFGLLVAALFRTERQAQPVAILVILVSSALGGSWWPLFITPAAMQAAANFTITRWAVDGLEGALWRGWSLGDTWGCIAVLTGIAGALFALAWARFGFEPERS